MVLFATDSVEIDKQSALELGEVLMRLSQLLEARVYLKGNADRVGSKAYNLALSDRRATSVKSALVAAGLPERVVRRPSVRPRRT